MFGKLDRKYQIEWRTKKPGFDPAVVKDQDIDGPIDKHVYKRT